MEAVYLTTIGQDSHRFCSMEEKVDDLTVDNRSLMLGGVRINDGTPPLLGNSDADVILHAVTNAISGYTGINILGGKADELCRKGVTDSAAYLKLALDTMPAGSEIVHVSLSLEGKKPRLMPYISAIKQHVADLLKLSPSAVGLTATSGEGLTAFGRGEGIQVFCLMTVRVNSPAQ